MNGPRQGGARFLLHAFSGINRRSFFVFDKRYLCYTKDFVNLGLLQNSSHAYKNIAVLLYDLNRLCIGNKKR